MAMYDREMIFSKDQTIAGNGTEYSTDKYDTGLADNPNINTNRELQVACHVTTAFAGGTDMTVNLVESANADLSSPTTLATSGAITTANLTAGKELLRTAVPKTSKRYIGFQFVSTGTAFTAGKVFGGIVRDTDDTAFPAQETGQV